MPEERQAAGGVIWCGEVHRDIWRDLVTGSGWRVEPSISRTDSFVGFLSYHQEVNNQILWWSQLEGGKVTRKIIHNSVYKKWANGEKYLVQRESVKKTLAEYWRHR